MCSVHINFWALLTFTFWIYRSRSSCAHYHISHFSIWICAVQLVFIHSYANVAAKCSYEKEVELDKWNTICLWVIDVTELKSKKQKNVRSHTHIIPTLKAKNRRQSQGEGEHSNKETKKKQSNNNVQLSPKFLAEVHQRALITLDTVAFIWQHLRK